MEALGRSGDIAVGISTSGRSENVCRGLRRARELGLKTMTLTGGDGGRVADLSDVVYRTFDRNGAHSGNAHHARPNAMRSASSPKLGLVTGDP